MFAFLYPYILALFRHGLTAVGVYLVAHGYMDASAEPEFIGAVMTIVGLGLSFVEKRLTQQRLVAAGAAPVAPPNLKTLGAFFLPLAVVLLLAPGLSGCAGLNLSPGASSAIQSALATAKALVPAAQTSVAIVDRLVPPDVAARLDRIAGELPPVLAALQDAANAGSDATVEARLADLEDLAAQIAAIVGQYDAGSASALSAKTGAVHAARARVHAARVAAAAPILMLAHLTPRSPIG